MTEEKVSTAFYEGGSSQTKEEETLDPKKMEEFVRDYDYLVSRELKKRGVSEEFFDDYKNLFYLRYFKNRNHLKHEESKGRTKENFIRTWIKWHIQCCNWWFDYTPENNKRSFQEKITTTALTDDEKSNTNQLIARDILMRLNEAIKKEEERKPEITKVLVKLSEQKKIPEIHKETGIDVKTIVSYKNFIREKLKKIMK